MIRERRDDDGFHGQSTTNDLSRYKLSKEDLEEKIRSRQHKPLEEYSGPPILVRSGGVAFAHSVILTVCSAAFVSIFK